jgi:PHD/YefM family antitoxin component YafN of YafNO toxin-antitoxin module
MRTRLYSDLYGLIQALCGISFAINESIRIKALINRRAAKVFRNSNYWTRFLVVGEERYCTPAPEVATTTIAGEGYFIASVGTTDFSLIGATANAAFTATVATTVLTVTAVSSGALQVGDYITGTGLTTGGVQITALGTGKGGVGTYTISPTQATLTSRAFKSFAVDSYFVATGAGTGNGTVRASNSTIPYTESGLSSVDTFLRIFVRKPYRKASVQEFEYYVTSDGADLVSGDLNPLTAFVTYKKQFTDIFGDGNGEVVNIPEEWFNYLAHGTYADWLKSEGQQEKAAMADAEAEAVLQEELIRLDENHTSGLVSNRIFTNANMQMRY